MHLQVVVPKFETKYEIPLFVSTVQAGFPSPATDYEDTKMDLNKYLIANPNSTFFVQVDGDSMIQADINSGDIAIVDRSLNAKSGDIILGVIDGDFVIKRLEIKENNGQKQIRLLPQNPDFEPILITQNMLFEIWGVVTYTIHKSC